MARLVKADLSFLERHGIPVALTFDASGLTRSDYRDRMKKEGKIAAYGVTRCQSAGHSLRNRHGTCMKCFPATIAYQQRAAAGGYVYIAQSESTGLVKVGFSADQVDTRLYIANLEAQGGCADWLKRATMKTKSAGRVEIDVHRALKAYCAPRRWFRNGAEVESREIYDCAYDTALSALATATRRSARARIVEYGSIALETE